MSILSDNYNEVSKSIVAICAGNNSSGYTRNAISGVLPEIIGTGFIVRGDGIIATNEHVINAAKDQLIQGQKVGAIIFAKLSFGFIARIIEIAGSLSIKNNPIKDAFDYGSFVPDLGFMRIKYQNLPTVKLNHETTVIEEGREVATAGFPFGVSLGKINKSVGPVLQSGIISSVFPFRGSEPHGFAINVMNHPGSSGSPVFLTSTGEVIGIHHSSLNVASNFSFILPARYISACLSMDLTKVGLVPFDNSVPDFQAELIQIEQAEKPEYEKALASISGK